MRATRPLPAEVVTDPAVLGGTPVVRGTRVPAATVLAELREGTSRAEIFRHYPSLPIDAIEACQRWAEESGADGPCASAS
jgi:uncharacterized protein (DUF433 family)